MTPGKVYGFSELQKIVSRNFRFSENFENPRKQNCKSAKKIFYRKCWKIEQQLKAEIEDGREAPW